MRKQLVGILAAAVLGFSAGIPVASASTARVIDPERTTHHLSGMHIAATAQFLAALKKASEAGRGAVAVTATGICQSGTSLCWRDMPNGSIDMWNRDIRGDSRQQWSVIYEGTETQTNCPVGGNAGVYAFLGFNGYYAGAGYTTNGGQSYYVGDGDTFDFWAWGTDGGLYNCADTRNTTYIYAFRIPAASWYEGAQLYTAPAGNSITPFQQISVGI